MKKTKGRKAARKPKDTKEIRVILREEETGNEVTSFIVTGAQAKRVRAEARQLGISPEDLIGRRLTEKLEALKLESIEAAKQGGGVQ